MFTKITERLFGSKPANETRQSAVPKAALLIRAIQEKSKEDPLFGAKVGAREICQRLRDALKNEKGAHVESVLCALGALSGYACQANLRAQAIEKGLTENAVFQIVEAKDGKRYFFGASLNNTLAGSKYSVWGLAANAAQQAGCRVLPDINEIFGHVTMVLGTDQFGIPRVPENHRPGDTPPNYLKALWPAIHPTLKLFCPHPADWPILFGLAAHEIITVNDELVEPGVALRILMESAISMSKIDLASI